MDETTQQLNLDQQLSLQRPSTPWTMATHAPQQATSTRTRSRKPAVAPPDSSRINTLMFWSLLLPIAVWLFVPSNGNGDHPPTTSVPDLSTSSFEAPQDPLPLASRPERPAAPPSAPEVAQLAPALEDLLRSLDESALSFHPDDDEHDDDDQDKDEEDDHVDPKDDRPSPSRRTSTAVKRAKEKMAKQKRVIKSNLKALKGGEVNPTGGPLLPILRATYTFLAPYLLSLLKFLSLPLTIPLNLLLSLLLLPWRTFQWIWQLVAPLAMLLGGFALIGVLCGASGAAVLRLWTWTFTPAADDGQAGEGPTRDEERKGRVEGRGGGRWSIPTKVRRKSAR